MSFASDPMFFAQRLEECQASFLRRGFGFRQLFGLGPKANNDELGKIHEPIKAHYRILEESGRVVWAAVVQANAGMFSPGVIDLPGVTVYSADPFYETHPQDLLVIAQACGQFKNTEPASEEFRPLARRITDEYDPTLRMPLPLQLTDGREVFLGASMFHRKRLPGGFLCASLFPMVIAPESTEVNMVLPLRYWSKILIEVWPKLSEISMNHRTSSKALEIADAMEKHPVQPRVADWDTHTTPVFVTNAMVVAFGRMIEEMKLDFHPLLSVGLHPDGARFASFVDGFDDRIECSFQSNGITVVVRKDQRELLRGAIVDYSDTEFLKTVVLRMPGE